VEHIPVVAGFGLDDRAAQDVLAPVPRLAVGGAEDGGWGLHEGRRGEDLRAAFGEGGFLGDGGHCWALVDLFV
jgi:hypothetical protein